MTQGYFTSGQASGMTQLPLGTIRRYVSQFGEHFSPQARVNSRGRRFTPRDVELLLAIRSMYSSGYTTEAVQKSLAGDWEAKALPSREISDAAKIVLEAKDYLDNTRQLVQRTTKRLDTADIDISGLQNLLTQLDERVNRLEVALQVKKAQTNWGFWDEVKYRLGM
jgi:DNA-binding transcriptional MerR regulator